MISGSLQGEDKKIHPHKVTLNGDLILIGISFVLFSFFPFLNRNPELSYCCITTIFSVLDSPFQKSIPNVNGSEKYLLVNNGINKNIRINAGQVSFAVYTINISFLLLI